MMGHKIYFYEEIWLIIPKYPCYSILSDCLLATTVSQEIFAKVLVSQKFRFEKFANMHKSSVYLSIQQLKIAISNFHEFLACLNKVQKELLHYPWLWCWLLRNVKVFTFKFLCDGQGTDRGAILSSDRSFYFN